MLILSAMQVYIGRKTLLTAWRKTAKNTQMPLEIPSKWSGKGHWRIICFPTPRHPRWEASGDFQPHFTSRAGLRHLSHSVFSDRAQCWAWGQSHNTCPFPALLERPAVQAATITRCVKCQRTLGAQWTHTGQHKWVTQPGDKGKQSLTWFWEADRAECHALPPGAGAKKRHQADSPAQRHRGGESWILL